LALAVTFLFVYEISLEPLNGFVPHSQGKCVRSLAQTSLNVRVTTDKTWGFRQISQDSLNWFATNSHGRRVWSLAWTSSTVKGQGHQRQKKSIFRPIRQPACGLCLVKHL